MGNHDGGNSQSAQLDTDVIFIDTEVFVREKFDWNSNSFTRLKELVKTGHLHVLTTSITKNEVMRKHREALDNAAKSVKKHEIILGQLGASTASEALNAPSAVTELEVLFQQFLTDIKAREVPLHANLDRLFEDYFAQTPPFSGGKKSEFPDAIVLSSLRNWCSQSRKIIYAVSGDPDFKIACDEGGHLLHVERLGDVISMATVTKQVHDDLLKFVTDSEYLASRLLEELKGCDVKFGRLYRVDDIDDVSGTVSDATDLNIVHLNVISRKENVFSCEIEAEVHLQIDLTIEVARQYGLYEEEYVPSRTIYETDSVWHYFYPQVEIRFDPVNPDDAEIESIDFSSTIEVDATDLDTLRHVHRRL
ncbi:PIN domain-containing protein [Bradyrhizobium sp. UFLA05-153]